MVNKSRNIVERRHWRDPPRASKLIINLIHKEEGGRQERRQHSYLRGWNVEDTVAQQNEESGEKEEEEVWGQPTEKRGKDAGCARPERDGPMRKASVLGFCGREGSEGRGNRLRAS
ncbi:hypothetical protein CRG98_016034 [Punica granatum]|uniref:Uncharacterized protein n=1 Tax=Punica granatum TaxID=22663 RepID=A0A2I0K5Z8_PUNGR|nr:hypothetical protein CRG98_016033 [Punica granatum]PKI63590.1 hypothetical protein CRG98_016034 [Punica granatum]